MDEVDRAYAIADAHLDRALARQRGAAARARERSSICVRCGEHIPPARLAAVDTSHCIDCARDAEDARGSVA